MNKGCADCLMIFPLALSCNETQVFIDRFESQLVGTDELEIRTVVDASYERIANAMFDSLQQMAKLDGGAEGLAPEDKGQLNYHVILIGSSEPRFRPLHFYKRSQP